MKYKKVLLVNPPSRGEWKGIRPHIGLGYIAEYLVNRGIEYDVLDMNLGYKFKHLQRKIETFRPDIVGMSLLTLEYKKFYGLLSLIKQNNPGIKTVAGGPHVTLFKEQVMRECPAIDYGVLYEGEETLVELCQGEGPDDQIKGLMSRRNGSIVYPGDRPFLEDLDTLSFPRYEKFELKKYIPEVEIYSSRGCPHECIFCTNRIISPYFRVRSAEHVVDEMEYWYKKGYRQYNFDDDNFNKKMDRVYQICDEIERAAVATKITGSSALGWVRPLACSGSPRSTVRFTRSSSFVTWSRRRAPARRRPARPAAGPRALPCAPARAETAGRRCRAIP